MISTFSNTALKMQKKKMKIPAKELPPPKKYLFHIVLLFFTQDTALFFFHTYVLLSKLPLPHNCFY